MPLAQSYLKALRRSLTAQISLAIALISIFLAVGSGFLVNRLTALELREESELAMVANLALLRDDLAVAGVDLTKTPQRLIKRMDAQLGNLHLAVLDEHRRVIAKSAKFEVPLAALPVDALPVDDFLDDFEHMDIADLIQRIGPITHGWTAPNGRTFRVLLGRISIPSRSAGSVGSSGSSTDNPRILLAAFATELTPTPSGTRRAAEILWLTVLIGAIASGLMGVWIARQILAGPKRLGAVANRISSRPLNERLSLERTPTELIESTQAFNRMLDRLDGAFRRLSDFSSDLAHDLRTPINNLLGEAQVALSRPRTAQEYQAVLESAVEDYERISRLIENMLFLARADDPKAATQREWVNLQRAAERVCGYFELLAEDREIGLRFELHAITTESAQVWADQTMLVRALGNLLSNALRYAPRGTNVVLSATVHAGGGCTFEVSNEGPPITETNQTLIFERCFRTDEARVDSAAGSGLGLAIVKSIMDLHGGTATVISGTGRHTSFRIWFPGPHAEVD